MGIEMNVPQELASSYPIGAMRANRNQAEHQYELAMEYARSLPTVEERLAAYRDAMVFNDLALACAKIIVLAKG
jgi:hypothetical protein